MSLPEHMLQLMQEIGDDPAAIREALGSDVGDSERRRWDLLTMGDGERTSEPRLAAAKSFTLFAHISSHVTSNKLLIGTSCGTVVLAMCMPDELSSLSATLLTGCVLTVVVTAMLQSDGSPVLIREAKPRCASRS